ncbi:MAG TPA: DUF3300 domain-containing protein [Steroidobacteraceae bacterium]
MTSKNALLASAFLILACMQPGCVSQPPDSEFVDTPTAEAEGEPLSPSPEDLDQLVAPIALYPDRLVGQILAAATYPTEVVEADRWLQQNTALKGDALTKAVDSQPWDPSVKALTQFPQVLDMMDKNLSWTSALGQAYAEGSQPVLDAVQVMRHRAQQAGTLASNQQETVQTQDSSVVIEPADPSIVYLPVFDPWLAYGEPIGLYPDWFYEPGLYIDGPGIAFGFGVGIGVYGGYGWGWNNWGTDWRGRGVLYNRGPWRSHSPTFAGRGGFPGRGGAFPGRGGGQFTPRPGLAPHPGFAPRSPGSPRAGGFEGGLRSGPFSGFNHGGMTRSFSSRGGTSFRGGGNFGGARSGGHR